MNPASARLSAAADQEERCYETDGAKVLSAGAFMRAGQATSRDVSPLRTNLWRCMTAP